MNEVLSFDSEIFLEACVFVVVLSFEGVLISTCIQSVKIDIIDAYISKDKEIYIIHHE
jgi:hypothetical protein